MLKDFVCPRKLLFRGQRLLEKWFKHCAGETNAKGGEGICKPIGSQNACWDDADCGPGGSCHGETHSPCGTSCVRGDQPGTCASSSAMASNMAPPVQILTGEVAGARQALLAAAALGKSDPDRALELERAVQAARAGERAERGAFVRRRFTH